MKYHVDPFVKDTVRVFPRQNRYSCLRYDMNENPEGLPNGFVESVLSEITPEFLSIYPEPDRFLNKYAAYIGAAYDNVLTTNGTDMAIRYILETFGEVDKEVVTVSPSFEMYWVNCRILGYKHVPVEYNDDLTIDIERIIGAISDDTRVVVLLNPNNPVGNVYTEEEVECVVKRAQEVGAIVIIDEAYYYFYDHSFINHALHDGNVIVLRTFSKLFSIAALRLGVIISTPDIIHYVKNARLTFDVNSVALLFGERLLDHPDLIDKLISVEKEGKEYILSELRKRGYECRDCMGNYIFICPKHNARELAEAMEKKENLLVHPYGNPLLSKYIRVSVGAKNAMKKFLDVFLRMDNDEQMTTGGGRQHKPTSISVCAHSHESEVRVAC